MAGSKNGKNGMTNRQKAALETKRKLFQAALSLLNEKDFDALSVQEIADRAGVAKGSFYTYFPSKEHILRYTYEDSDRIYDAVWSRLAPGAFLFRLTAFIQASYTEMEQRGRGILKALITHSAALADLYQDPRRSLYHCLAALVEEGQQEKFLSPALPAALYVRHLATAMNGAEFYWSMKRGSFSLTEEAVRHVRSIALGMHQWTEDNHAGLT